MSESTSDKLEKSDAKAGAKPAPIAVRLTPANDSDQPVLSNYVSLQPASGMLLIDFGFLEPAVLAALPGVARRGGKLPESLNGRLAVRVAMGYESAIQLQNQLTRLIEQMSKAMQASKREAEGRG
jgi:hypothetical protein